MLPDTSLGNAGVSLGPAKLSHRRSCRVGLAGVPTRRDRTAATGSADQPGSVAARGAGRQPVPTTGTCTASSVIATPTIVSISRAQGGGTGMKGAT